MSETLLSEALKTSVPTHMLSMTSSSFTNGEAVELARLLRKVQEDNGWMPTQETFEALGAARPLPATDLIIIDARGILLTMYDAGVTKFLGKWHIPGGYVLPNRTLEEDCDKVALRELGTHVRFIKVLGAYKWTHEEHSQGQPVSMFMHCEPLTPITETETCKYFLIDQLPEDMIECQRRFIMQSNDIKVLCLMEHFDQRS